MTIKGVNKREFKKRFVDACGGCTIQHNGWPCGSCTPKWLTNAGWRAVLAYRGDYDTPEFLKGGVYFYGGDGSLTTADVHNTIRKIDKLLYCRGSQR